MRSCVPGGFEIGDFAAEAIDLQGGAAGVFEFLAELEHRVGVPLAQLLGARQLGTLADAFGVGVIDELLVALRQQQQGVGVLFDPRGDIADLFTAAHGGRGRALFGQLREFGFQLAEIRVFPVRQQHHHHERRQQHDDHKGHRHHGSHLGRRGNTGGTPGWRRGRSRVGGGLGLR